MTATNWTKIAERDQQLRAAEGKASEALAKFRYDHTIAVGVTFTEYADKCGIDKGTVRRYARAWELRSSAPQDLDIGEALVRAAGRAERADVVEVIAEARGLEPTTVLGGHKDEINRIESLARERAAKRDTTVREEAARIADWQVRSERAHKNLAEQRAGRLGFRVMELEKHLLNARRALTQALRVDVDLDDEGKEIIAATLANVKAVLQLVEMRYVGMADIDWDAEMAKLGDDV